MKQCLALAAAYVLAITAPLVVADSVWDESRVSYEGERAIEVYRGPQCSCCEDWLDHLKKHGFRVTDKVRGDMAAIKLSLGVPPAMASCHTAKIDGYVIEGHVPADDIKRLLTERPGVVGLSVPRMPVGTPGMEMGARKDPFRVLSFDDNGDIEVYREYRDY